MRNLVIKLSNYLIKKVIFKILNIKKNNISSQTKNVPVIILCIIRRFRAFKHTETIKINNQSAKWYIWSILKDLVFRVVEVMENVGD